MSYLTDRKQFVRLNGTSSTTQAIFSGVPQGSILGPLLFSMFINDMSKSIKSSLKLFADDSNLLLAADQINRLFPNLC